MQTEGKGWAVVDFDGTGMLEVQDVDEERAPDDEAAGSCTAF